MGMTPDELIADLRSRINPVYADQKGTESYERRLCAEALEALLADNERKDDALRSIKNWSEAYPLEVFPEPDFKKAAVVLKDAGMTVDAISASNMRHVLSGIKDIVDAGLAS